MIAAAVAVVEGSAAYGLRPPALAEGRARRWRAAGVGGWLPVLLIAINTSVPLPLRMLPPEQAGGTPPKFLIIDDGWQQTDTDPPYRPMGECVAAVGAAGR